MSENLPLSDQPKTIEKEDSSTSNPVEVQRALEKMVDSGRSSRETFMALAGTMGGNPLHNKMTPEHVTQVLTLSEKHDEREYNLSTRQQDIEDKRDARTRQYHLIFFVLALITFGFTMILFKDKPETLKPVLTGVGGLVSGFLAGMGYSKGTKKD